MSIYARFALTRGDFTLEVNLELPGHGITALFGVSGSGKTTLLQLIAGLDRASGFLEINGVVWQDSAHGLYIPVHRRELGFIFQEASLFAHLSVQHNIEYGLWRVAYAKRRVNPAHIIELLDLGRLLGRKTAHLSGGERQRVAIARALLTSPQLLLMDEPLAALDHARKQEILPYLERLHAKISLPVLYVSHAHDEIARLADHLVVLERGHVVAHGPLAETLTSLDVPVRLGEDAGVVLTGVLAVRDSEWHLAQVDCGGISLWVRDGGQALGQTVRLRVLARDVGIALAPQISTSILNVLPAQVIELGSDTHPSLILARLTIGNSPLLARLTKRSAVNLNLHRGITVWVQIKAAAVIG